MKKIVSVFCITMTNIVFAGNVYQSAFAEMAIALPRPIIQLTFPYNINTDYVSTTLVSGGTVTQSSNMAVLQTTTNTAGSATLISKDRLPYRPGQGCTAIFTAIFTTGVSSNTQRIGVGGFNTTPAIQDGFFFGYNGTSFGIFWYNNSTSPTFIAQTSWNGDKFDGSGTSGVTLVPTNGNVYKIQYQWLGFGPINFYIEKPSTSEFILVHTIQYGNANITPTLRNPALQLVASVTNSGNATNITLRTSSMSGIVEGKTNLYTDARNSAFNFKAISTTETNIITIQNKSTYQGVANQVVIYPDFIALMNISTGTNAYQLRLKLNPTVGGTPVFTDVSTNTSVVAFDTAGTTITAATGTLLVTFYVCANTDLEYISLKDMGIALMPGDRLVVSGRTNTSTDTMYCGISWTEGF